MNFERLFEQRSKSAAPQSWMNWQRHLLSDLKTDKEKEFFGYVEKVDWQLVEPALIGPAELVKISEPQFSNLDSLTAASKWTSALGTAAWSLKIVDDRYLTTPAEIVIAEPSGPGFKLASGFIDVSLEKYKKAKIFLHFKGGETPTTEHMLALQTQVSLAEHSELELFIVQDQAIKNSHISNFKAELAESAVLKIYHVNGGSSWSESNYHFIQNGEYSFSDLKVLQLGTNGQKHRIWANSSMNSSYTRTSQLVKCLLNGQAKNHFIGRISIAKDITEVDAFQKNQNLLLSRQAQALNQPELEVLSDNVKAAHGSATGFMNQDELFYLESRGLTEFEGRKFLAEGFAYSLFSELDPAIKAKALKVLDKRIHHVCT